MAVCVLGEGEPELAGLEDNVLVLVLGGVEHVLRHSSHFGHELLKTGGEQEDEGLADVATDRGVVIRSELEEGGDEVVEVDKEGLGADGDKVR